MWMGWRMVGVEKTLSLVSTLLPPPPPTTKSGGDGGGGARARDVTLGHT